MVFVHSMRNWAWGVAVLVLLLAGCADPASKSSTPSAVSAEGNKESDLQDIDIDPTFVEKLKQLTPDQLAAEEQTKFEDVIKLKKSIAGMKAEVDRSQNAHLQSGLKEMKMDYRRRVATWMVFRQAQGKSIAVPSEFALD